MKTNRWIVAFAATAAQYARASHAGSVTRLLPAGQLHAVMDVLTLSGIALLALAALAGWLLANPSAMRCPFRSARGL